MNTTQNAGAMLEIAGLAAQIILENGAETYRVEDTVLRLCRSYGFIDASVLALSTGVAISLSSQGRNEAVIRRVSKRSLNLSRVNEVNDLSRRIAGGGIGMDAALQLLTSIQKSPQGKPVYMIFLAGLSAGCFALMFGGGILECLIALLCGMTAQAIGYAFRRADFSLILISLTGGLLCSAITMCACFLFPLTPASMETALSGAIMPLVSGLMMTNAVRDALRGDLISGLARSVEALLVAIMVALGISLLLRFYLPGGEAEAAASPAWYLAVLYAGIATLFFCPLLKVPGRSVLPACLLGAAAYGGFLLLRDTFLVEETMALLLASGVSAILCDMLARHMRMITTIFLCVALIPLVPGLGLYRTMRELLLGRYEAALTMGVKTLLAVGAIALGAAIGSLRLPRLKGVEKG